MKYFAYCRKSSEAEERQALSLESQAAELKRAFGGAAGIEIVEVLYESMSAKAPGRPIFNAMLERIRRGEAAGIISWHPDRLARNSIDGGQIIYLLDQRTLVDMRFASFSFENSSQGKFMLQIMFGYSKYYVDNLSENVRRGNRAKAERGWRPGQLPVGYRHCPVTHTIVTDPITFPVMKRVFQTALQGSYNARELWRIATQEWGLRGVGRGKLGWKSLSQSSFYNALGNDFYTGRFWYDGQLRKGGHEAAITLEQFQQIQRWLGRENRRCPSRHVFTYTGLLRCGGCGLMITAEQHQKRGRTYVYYRCTRRSSSSDKCKQPPIPEAQLEQQIIKFLGGLQIDPVLDAELKVLARRQDKANDAREVADQALQETIDALRKKEATALDLRINGLISDEEFASKREEIQLERTRFEERRAELSSGMKWFEPYADSVSFSQLATAWFIAGNIEIRRLILKSVGLNLQLTDKNFSALAAFPFVCRQNKPLFLCESGCRESNSVYIHPMDAYYRYTTARMRK